ncbi:MAG: polysaccharide deacetylase family protein [Hyphomicrobiaceae bacterium]
MGRTIVTTSWDDGAIEDARVAELLAKYGIMGTFYVPRSNRERSVMPDLELRNIAAQFEIGSHTHDHVFLTTVSEDFARRQIIDGTMALEDVLGQKVHGFCYPGGYFNAPIRQLVRQSGLGYARTVVNLVDDLSTLDPFQLPTSIHFFPRAGYKHIKTYLAFGDYQHRWRSFTSAARSGSISDRAHRLVDICAQRQGYFHLWGHSWEIEAYDLWSEFELILAKLSQTFSPVDLVSNRDAVLRARSTADPSSLAA